MLLKATVIGHRAAGKGQLIGLITGGIFESIFIRGQESRPKKNFFFKRTLTRVMMNDLQLMKNTCS